MEWKYPCGWRDWVSPNLVNTGVGFACAFPGRTRVAHTAFCPNRIQHRAGLAKRPVQTRIRVAHVVRADLRTRRATQEDYKAVWSLIASEKLNPLIGDINNFVVCEDDSIGVIACAQVRGNELSSVVVRREFRNRGIGARVVRDAMGEATGDLYLVTASSRLKWYEQFGFVPVKSHALPASMRLERLVGSLVIAALEPGHTCVGMYRAGSTAPNGPRGEHEPKEEN